MTIIHMEVEEIRSLAERLRQMAMEFSDGGQRLTDGKWQLTGAWQGGSAEEFIAMLDETAARLREQANQINELAGRVSREVDEWEQADQGTSFGSTSTGLPRSSGTVVGGVPPLPRTIDRRATEIGFVVNRNTLPLIRQIDPNYMRSRWDVTPASQNSGIPETALSDLPQSEAIPGFGDLETLTRVPPLQNVEAASGRAAGAGASQAHALAGQAATSQGHAAIPRSVLSDLPVSETSSLEDRALFLMEGYGCSPAIQRTESETARVNAFMQTEQGQRLFGNIGQDMVDRIPTRFFDTDTVSLTRTMYGYSIGERVYVGRGENASPRTRLTSVLAVPPHHGLTTADLVITPPTSVAASTSRAARQITAAPARGSQTGRP